MSADTVLFFGHEVSASSRLAYDELRRSSGARRHVRWLLDVAGEPDVPADLAGEMVTFDSREFAGWGYSTFGPKMLPGHCHFPALRHAQAHPLTGSLWTIEYDVRFNGSWDLFFDALDHSDADLLTCHVRTWQQEPYWHWWSTLRGPAGEKLEQSKLRRCLLVVARYSVRALAELARLHACGWRGHQEVIVPTLLEQAGMVIRDINEAGAGARRFYTSTTSPRGKMRGWLSTVRYRPVRNRTGWRRNMLYHPVKPASWNSDPK
jgi:hypothetical protein